MVKVAAEVAGRYPGPPWIESMAVRSERADSTPARTAA
jgi:hypothetical protein